MAIAKKHRSSQSHIQANLVTLLSMNTNGRSTEIPNASGRYYESQSEHNIQQTRS